MHGARIEPGTIDHRSVAIRASAGKTRPRPMDKSGGWSAAARRADRFEPTSDAIVARLIGTYLTLNASKLALNESDLPLNESKASSDDTNVALNDSELSVDGTKPTLNDTNLSSNDTKLCSDGINTSLNASLLRPRGV